MKIENGRIIENENCLLNYDEQDDEIVLELVQVDPSQQGKGIGRKLMDKFIEMFEDDERPLTLYAEQQIGEDGLSNEQLVEWYESFGFEADSELGGLPFMRKN